MVRAAGCSKSRVAKAAGAEVAVQQRNEKWHAAVARSTFSSQNAKTEGFGAILQVQIWKNCSGAKHISSQNVQNASASEQFLKCRC